MPELSISPQERKLYRAQAHRLAPVVFIGQGGLSAAVEREVDTALKAHGLIKIRVFDDDRQRREAFCETLCDKLDAAPIQHIGKLLVLWRPVVQAAPRPPGETAMPGPREVKILRYGKRGGQRPEVRRVRVLGNERITQQGRVKRADARQKSLKKSRLG